MSEYHIITHGMGTFNKSYVEAQIRKLPGILNEPDTVKVFNSTEYYGAFSIYIRLNGPLTTDHQRTLNRVRSWLAKNGLIKQ